jgi:hypothetical protein
VSAHDAGELRPGFEPATRRLLPNGSDFGNKAREWDRKAFLYDTRRKWDRHVNRALALGGSAARFDRRSLKAQLWKRLIWLSGHGAWDASWRQCVTSSGRKC